MRYALEQFHWNGEHCENLLDYEPGGYHPIHLGDTFSTLPHSTLPRYRVVNKLGYGTFSTVWLARDLVDDHTYVALKINVSRLTDVNNESGTLRRLQSQPYTHPGQLHILSLRDSFFVSGPNGKHEVLVTDVVAPLQGLEDHGILKCHSRRICLQAIMGLAYLQEHGVSHGDLHFGNLACTAPGLEILPEERLLKILGNPECVPVLSRDPSRDTTSLPKYMVPSISILDVVIETFKSIPGPAICVKITDFGNAHRPTDSRPPPHIVTPLTIRAPEIYFNLKSGGMVDDDWGLKSDVWSLACTMHEIVYSSRLFFRIGQEESLIEAMINICGKLPPRWQPYWNAASKAQGKVSIFYGLHIPRYGDSEDPLVPNIEENWRRIGEPDEFVDGFSNLLRSMLRLDPLERPSASELLNHPWFDAIKKPNFR